MTWDPKKERNATSSRKYLTSLRIRVLKHYGGDPPKCACCGELEIEFLTIDHVNGVDHSLPNSNGGSPPGEFQILCWNCNCAKGKLGYCPHKRKELMKALEIVRGA